MSILSLIPATKGKFEDASKEFISCFTDKGILSSALGAFVLGSGMSLCGGVSFDIFYRIKNNSCKNPPPLFFLFRDLRFHWGKLEFLTCYKKYERQYIFYWFISCLKLLLLLIKFKIHSVVGVIDQKSAITSCYWEKK